MKDIIYREDAINAVEEALQNVFVEPKGLGEKIINPLPSAYLTYVDSDIQKKQDLEQAQLDKAYELGKAEAESN